MFKNDFSAGELDKWQLAAFESPQYQRGCAWLENFSLIDSGGINRRKGYKHIQDILQGAGDEAVKFAPFQTDGTTTYLVYFSNAC